MESPAAALGEEAVVPGEFAIGLRVCGGGGAAGAEAAVAEPERLAWDMRTGCAERAGGVGEVSVIGSWRPRGEEGEGG